MISDSTPDRPEFSLAGVDLEGSILGEMLKQYRVEGVYTAPKIGVNFVEPWLVEWPDEQ